MTQNSGSLKRLEGNLVMITLIDGGRLDGCRLVSAGRRGGTVWICVDGLDTFIPQTDIVAATPAVREDDRTPTGKR